MKWDRNLHICHHLPLKHRKERILEGLDRELNKLTDDHEMCKTTLLWETSFQRVHNFRSESVKINDAEFSLFLKHAKLWRKFSNSEECDLFLVMEDDIHIADGFYDMLAEFIDKFPEDCDIAFIGGTKDLVPVDKTSLYDCGKDYTSRCTHAYLITSEAAQKFLDVLSFDLPVDHWFNRAILGLNLNCCWTSRYFEQETVMGIEKSSIR